MAFPFLALALTAAQKSKAASAKRSEDMRDSAGLVRDYPEDDYAQTEPREGSASGTGPEGAGFQRENPYDDEAGDEAAKKDGSGDGSILASIIAQGATRMADQSAARRQAKANIYAQEAKAHGAPTYGYQAAKANSEIDQMGGTNYLNDLLPIMERRRERNRDRGR